MTLIVMGGRGFVGSAFVRHAASTSTPYLVVTRENYSQQRGSVGQVFVNANGNPRKYLAEREPVLDFAASVTTVVQSLQDFPGRTYVYLSSTAIYPEPQDPELAEEETAIEPKWLGLYGFHRLLAETIVRKYARSWLIARLGGMVGPRLAKGPIFDLLTTRSVRTSWDSQFQLLLTDYVAATILALVDRGVTNQVINVCGRGAVVLGDVYTQVFGTTPPPNGLPVEAWHASSTKLSQYTYVPRSNDTLEEFLESDFALELHKRSTTET